MSSFSGAFHDHLRKDCTTVCHCWMVRRRDGIVFGFTDHDQPLAVAGNSYKPQGGFSQTEAVNSLGMAVDTADVEGVISSEELKETDIAAGFFDGAEVETLLVNWCDTTQFAILRKSTIGKITRADGHFVAELESISASLDKPNGRILRRECDARLGDSRCGFNLKTFGFSAAGTVMEINSSNMLIVSGLDTSPPDWFAFGEVFWTSGKLKGRTAIIAEHRVAANQTMLRLAASEPLPHVGDSFAIVAGCDKRFATCKAKFSNPDNFRGFPHLPGNDAAYGYATDGMVFDGKALVE